jgi:hypothetical protein
MTTSGTSYVDIPTDFVEDVDYGYINPDSNFAKAWAEALGKIAEYHGYLVTANGEMDNLALFQLPENYRTVLDNVIIDAVDPITDTTGRPTKPVLSLPDEWPDVDKIPILGYLRPVPQQDLSYTAPDVPPDPGGGLNWTPGAYTSAILDPLYDAIYSGIQNGGTGLAEAVEAALWARGRERQRVANAREWKRAMDATGADGFDFAAGPQATILLSMSAEMLQQDENLNNGIIKISADLAQVNTHSMLDKGMALEQLFRQFFNDNENRSLDAQKAIAQYVLDKYRAAVEVYRAQWEGVKAEIEAKIAFVELVLKENQQMFEKFTAEMGAYTAEIDLVAKKISAIVEGYKGEVDGYRAEIDERAAWWKALTEEQKVRVEANRLKLEKAISQVKMFIDGTLSINGLRGDLVKTKGGLLAQMIASALGAINASFSINHSGSESKSESVTRSEGVSEGHNFEETAT